MTRSEVGQGLQVSAPVTRGVGDGVGVRLAVEAPPPHPATTSTIAMSAATVAWRRFRIATFCHGNTVSHGNKPCHGNVALIVGSFGR
jgi:hypothetical protein